MTNFPFTTGEEVLASDANEMYPSIFYIFRYVDKFYYSAATDNDKWLWATSNQTNSIYMHRYRINRGKLIDSSANSTYTYWQLTTDYENCCGIVYINGYLYMWAQETGGASAWFLLRMNVNDNPLEATWEEMTISGTAPDQDNNNRLATDGTNLYIADVATTTVRKYTISGTTATYDSAITMPDKVFIGFGASNDHFYFSTSDSGNTINNVIYKTDLSGNIVWVRKNEWQNYSTNYITDFFEHHSTMYMNIIGRIVSATPTQFILELDESSE